MEPAKTQAWLFCSKGLVLRGCPSWDVTWAPPPGPSPFWGLPGPGSSSTTVACICFEPSSKHLAGASRPWAGILPASLLRPNPLLSLLSHLCDFQSSLVQCLTWKPGPAPHSWLRDPGPGSELFLRPGSEELPPCPTLPCPALPGPQDCVDQAPPHRAPVLWVCSAQVCSQQTPSEKLSSQPAASPPPSSHLLSP